MENKTVYVALGDSITEATPGFVSIIAKSINADRSANHGVSARTSGELLSAVKSDSKMRESLKSATVVTVTIGSNDIFQKNIQNIAKVLGCKATVEGVNAAFFKLQTEFNNARGFNKIFVGLKMASMVYSMKSAVYNTNTMKTSANEYKSTLSNILKVVGTLAPNAKIYLGNLYNPYIGTSPTMIGSYKLFDISEVIELWETQYNAVLKQVASSTVKVVDLHSVIKSQSQLLCDTNNGSWDPHPNSKGHQDIANAFLKAMK